MTQPSANDTTPDEPWQIEYWWQGKLLDRIIHTYPRDWAIRDVYMKWRNLVGQYEGVTVRFRGNGEDLDHEQFMAAVPDDLIAWGNRIPKSPLPEEYTQQVMCQRDQERRP